MSLILAWAGGEYITPINTTLPVKCIPVNTGVIISQIHPSKTRHMRTGLTWQLAAETIWIMGTGKIELCRHLLL